MVRMATAHPIPMFTDDGYETLAGQNAYFVALEVEPKTSNPLLASLVDQGGEARSACIKDKLVPKS